MSTRKCFRAHAGRDRLRPLPGAARAARRRRVRPPLCGLHAQVWCPLIEGLAESLQKGKACQIGRQKEILATIPKSWNNGSILESRPLACRCGAGKWIKASSHLQLLTQKSLTSAIPGSTEPQTGGGGSDRTAALSAASAAASALLCLLQVSATLALCNSAVVLLLLLLLLLPVLLLTPSPPSMPSVRTVSLRKSIFRPVPLDVPARVVADPRM